MNTKSIITKRFNLSSIYLLLLIIVFLQRLFWLLKFAVVFTDSDQTVMWVAAGDIANGIFRAPCFYGQSYSPLIESFLSAPLVWAGIPVWFALPLITSTLAVMPVVFLGNYFRKSGNVAAAIIALSVFIALPPEYYLLTSVSRGFVTGIVLGIPALILILKNRNFFALIFSGILMGLAIYANMNSILLSPLFFLSLFSGKKLNYKKLGFFSIGFILGISSIALNSVFYLQHHEMIIHGSPSLNLSLDAFISVISRLDSYFQFITPVFWRFGYILLPGIPVLAIILFRKKEKVYALTVWMISVMILWSMFSNKVADGTNSVFFSGSRMYLAYPFLIVFMIVFILELLNAKQIRYFIRYAFVCSVISMLIQVAFSNKFIHNELKGSKNKIVQVESIKTLKRTCRKIQSIAGNKDVLVVSTYASVISYGCPCLMGNFPPSLVAGYERRTWLSEEVADIVFPEIIICNADSAFLNRLSEESQGLMDYYPHDRLIVIENTSKTSDFLKLNAFRKN